MEGSIAGSPVVVLPLPVHHVAEDASLSVTSEGDESSAMPPKKKKQTPAAEEVQDADCAPRSGCVHVARVFVLLQLLVTCEYSVLILVHEISLNIGDV